MATFTTVHEARWFGEKLKKVIVKLTPHTAYATGGDPIDLTGVFNHICWGGQIISVPDATKGGIKFDINSQGVEGTAISTTNVKLLAYRDPALGTAAQGDFVEVTNGTNLSTYVLHVMFWGY